jgi:surfeit locus 1 family protein
MLKRLRQARLVWPTLAALAGFAVLVGLGTWQIERKRWKDGLIARITAGVNADPVPLASVTGSAVGKDREYTHVSVFGRFHHDKERYLYAPTPAGQGWHVYTPLETAEGALVWINRGLVPDMRKAPGMRSKGQTAGEVEVRGLVRFPPASPGLFAAQNDPTHNIWYWPDLAAMTASAFAGSSGDGPTGPHAARALPLVVEADAKPAPPGGLPRGGVTRLDLPNRHLEYALTWYGLAATLIGVYLAFSISRLRTAS